MSDDSGSAVLVPRDRQSSLLTAARLQGVLAVGSPGKGNRDSRENGSDDRGHQPGPVAKCHQLSLPTWQTLEEPSNGPAQGWFRAGLKLASVKACSQSLAGHRSAHQSSGG